ncbi:MAG: hypothetical protein H7210_11535 [Pyrinomonadaceae bacterium]|nr:hypothetical protein [Phycisphaerales bacterium]
MKHVHTLSKLNASRMFMSVAIGSSVLVAGCSDSRSVASGPNGDPRSAVVDRPRVPQSAAEVAPGGGSAQLDFFDELESHELATQDDALHAVLLAFHGSSAPTYVQRAAIAKQIGLMNPRTNPQPRDAVTVGEVSQLLFRSLAHDVPGPNQRTDRGSQTSEQALASMQKIGVLPPAWRASRGITGPELLAAIKNAGRLAEGQRHSAAGKE